MTTNIQIGNVGNVGDIIKHVALTQLIQTCSPTLYIDFHTFRLFAPCSDVNRWKREVEKLKGSDEKAFEKYIELEKQILENKPYRCSSGLAIDLLKKNAKFVFSEQDKSTREILREQVEQEKVEYIIMNHSSELKNLLVDKFFQKMKNEVVFSLVDPFVLNETEWNEICDGLNEFNKKYGIKEGVIEVFNYDKQGGDKVNWNFTPPAGFTLVGSTYAERYALAVYATSGIAGKVIQELKKLGWSIK